MTILSATVLLLLVMDPLGNMPVFGIVLGEFEPRRARAILVRELLIALAVLVVFLLAGRCILDLLQVTEPALSISGGVILFLIALRMIFAAPGELLAKEPEGEPFVVPLAIPLIAGPAAIATVLILAAREPNRLSAWLFALLLAWTVTGLILLAACWFRRVLGPRGLTAVQRLMGMLLATVAIQMLLMGLKTYWTYP